jgi:hypothetical protein
MLAQGVAKTVSVDHGRTAGHRPTSGPQFLPNDLPRSFHERDYGNEKGAMLTHPNIVSDVYQACYGIFLKVTHEDVLYACFLCTIATAVPRSFSRYQARSRMRLDRDHRQQILNDMKWRQVTIFMRFRYLHKLLQDS